MFYGRLSMVSVISREIVLRKTTIVLSGLLLIVVAIAVVIPHWNLKDKSSAKATAATEATPTSLHRMMSLNQALVMLHSRYRLKPDRRFLLAAQDIVNFMNEGPDCEAAVRFADDEWKISCGSKALGEFPKIPDFDDAMRLLQQLATKRLDQIGFRSIRNYARDITVPKRFRIFNVPGLLNAVKKLPNTAGAIQRNPAVLAEAAMALCRLDFMRADAAGVGDAFSARTLAALAIAISAGFVLDEEESMAAYNLGYREAAIERADTLPANNSWKSYLNQDDHALLHAARIDSDDPEAPYLWLWRLAQQNNLAAWKKWVRLRFSHSINELGVATTAISLGSIAVDRWSGISLMRGAARLVGGGDEFAYEPKAHDAASRWHSPFLTPKEYLGLVNSFYFGGAWQIEYVAIDRRDVPSEADGVIATVGKLQSPLGKEVARWLVDYQRLSSGQISADRAVADGLGFRLLGAAPRFGLLDKAMQKYPDESWRRTEIARHAVTVLDTRPAVAIDYANWLGGLGYLSAARQLWGAYSSGAARPRANIDVWLAQYNEGPKALVRIAMDSGVKIGIRRYAAELLDQSGASEATMLPLYDAMLASDPTDGATYLSYINLLKKHGDYAHIIGTAKKWQLNNQGKQPDPFDYWRAIVATSFGLMKIGKADAAWREIKPILGSYYGRALTQGVRVLLALNRIDEARKLARAEADRYPNSIASVMPVVRVYWRAGKYQQAAAILDGMRPRITGSEWRKDVATVFVKALGGDVKRAVSAFKAMVDAKIDPDMLNIVAEVAGQHNPELGFRVCALIRRPGLAGISESVNAYRFLKKWRGADKALAWLHGQIPQRFQVPAAMVYFDMNEPDLLWEMIAATGDSNDDQAVWLYRSAAFVMSRRQPYARKMALTAHYAEAGNGWYDRLGRYVLGLNRAAIPLDKKMTVRQISEASFYLGLRALKDGKIDEGLDWLRVDLETEDQHNGEYRWAYGLLRRIESTARDPAVLAREGRLFEAQRSKAM